MTAAYGFFGKIPGRGDFVRGGLPPEFVQPLDTWWQAVLSGSRGVLGEAWVEAWMEAPVWRFALSPGVCGPGAAAGLWLPSTDRAGRLFPLVLAAVGPRWADVAGCAAFLDAAETIGLRAIETDIGPEDVSAAIADAPHSGGDPIAPPPPGASVWWTSGSPRVAPSGRTCHPLPDGAGFAAMLQDAGGPG